MGVRVMNQIREVLLTDDVNVDLFLSHFLVCKSERREGSVRARCAQTGR